MRDFCDVCKQVNKMHYFEGFFGVTTNTGCTLMNPKLQQSSWTLGTTYIPTDVYSCKITDNTHDMLQNYIVA